jgi:alpha-L-fucosidase
MAEYRISRRQALKAVAVAVAVAAFGGAHAENEETLLANPSFEADALAPWRRIAGTAQVVGTVVHEGGHALALGPGASVEQTVTVRPNSMYRLTGWLQSGSGAETVRLGVRSNGGDKDVAIALVTFSQTAIEFTTGPNDRQAVVYLLNSSGKATSYADDLELRYVGPAARGSYDGVTNSITALPPRIPKTDLGIAQQSNDSLRWLLDAKFGMFIHWGLYAGPGHGEWYMHNAGMPPDQYRKYAFPESGDEYFAADKYDPGHWAEVAKAAGMKWTCLTARHHEGFCLFDSPHPNAFTSVQTLKRDLVMEYTRAVRKAGLKVGLYYSPLSWRYPGYYDVTGLDCKPNPFGYKTDPAHKENARLMKEENYANVKRLVTAYGKIDHIFWDGGWLGERGSDRDAAFFHEPGHFLDPHNPWPIGEQYQDHDSSGKALGIMGLIRQHQPHAVVNPRYGWIGDFGDEEGPAAVTGPIRDTGLIEKCLSMQSGPWGYSRDDISRGNIFSRDRIIDYLANCVVRNMVMLLNFGPDRHGQIPPLVEQRLRETGAWLAQVGEAVYGTRGGPWQPKDGQYGFCRKLDTVYIHLLKGYVGSAFTLPPVGPLRPIKAYDVFTKQSLSFVVNPDRTVVISGIDRATNPADTIVAVRFDSDVMAHAVERSAV